jgi:branched-chain amino acid transport system ATP-binding protein
MALVAVENLCKSFGSLKVTSNLSFQLQRGEALGVLGPNGAGKTTLFNLITGDVIADSGHVFFKDREITRIPPHQRCRAGIGRSYQIALPFEGMTVFENLLVGAMFGAEQSESQASDLCVSVLERTGRPQAS